jgi:hypothetical protein
MKTSTRGIRKNKTPTSIPFGVVQYDASAAAPTINAANEIAYVNLKAVSFRKAYNRTAYQYATPTVMPSSTSTNSLTKTDIAPDMGQMQISSAMHCMTAQARSPRRANDRSTARGPASLKIWPPCTYKPIPRMPLMVMAF